MLTTVQSQNMALRSSGSKSLSKPSLLSRRPTVSVSAIRVDPNAPVQANSSGQLSSQLDERPQQSRVEQARKYFRTVYDFPQWEKHRKSSRLIDRLLSINQSHIMGNIAPSLIWVGGVASLLVLYQAFEQASGISGLPDFHNSNPTATAFVSNTSVALSLLLVFRTNASYGRWDEARKMWGGLLNRSRDIMRQGVTIFPAEDVEAKKALARWTVAFARALRIHFQPEVSIEDELAGILKPNELRMLRKAPHRPVQALHALSQVIQNTVTDPIHQQQMSANITFYQDVLGGCERLLRAPIPVSYTRHTARFLFLWLTILPFSLYPSLGAWTIPAVVGVAGVLCGIEEIGVQCEEPFGILPLDVICNRIQADVMNTLKDDEAMKAVLYESMDRANAPVKPRELASSKN